MESSSPDPMEENSAMVQVVRDNQVRLQLFRPGVQPGQLPATAGAAEGRSALVADHAAGQADQDWRKGGPDTPGT